jgi:uncharacterized secreted protein with C-terminal beta-propeller domain
MAWKLLGTRAHTNKACRPRLAVERLEDRCLLDSGLSQFGSADAFKQYLIDSALNQYKDLFGQHFQGRYGHGILVSPPVFFDATTAPAAGGSFSQTNVQVQGVDEGDLVKTDGTYIYAIAQQQLFILKAGLASDLSIVSRVPLSGNVIGEYLDGDRLTVITTTSNTSDTGPLQAVPLYIVTRPGGNYGTTEKTTVMVFDVANRSAPHVVQATDLDGFYISSRAIGHDVYVVTQQYFVGLPAPAYTFFNGETDYETKDQYLARIAGHEFDLALPHYYVHAADGSVPAQPIGLLTDPAQIYKPESAYDNTLFSVSVFDDTSSTAGASNSVSSLGSGSTTVYASLQHLYLVRTDWSGANGVESQIVEFNLDGAKVSLIATGSVPGQVVDPFSMDEQGVFFRITTTAGFGSSASNNLYVLAQSGDALDIVGRLENLAPGEKLYSTRFLGDRAFLVTYKQFDPLFAIDLSNPTNPRLAGQLQLPGFSKYLQAIDATHLIGIGLDVGPNNETAQLKVSLFDVSDLNNPKLIDTYEINPNGWRWASGSEATWDHHAFSYFPEDQTLAIPIDGTYTGTDYAHLHSSLWVFRVDVHTGFKLLGQIDHDTQARRSLRIGDQLYSVADGSIQVHPIQDPTAAGTEVRFDDAAARLVTPVPVTVTVAAPYAGSIASFQLDDASNLEAIIDWGDGQQSVGAVVATGNGRYAVTGTHTFTRAGSFYATATLRRRGSLVGTLSTPVQVTDPDPPPTPPPPVTNPEPPPPSPSPPVTDPDPQTSDFVAQLYRDLLHREVDASGLANWGGLLRQHQLTRAQVAQALVSSPEYRNNLVQSLYAGLLGRVADPSGLDTFVGLLGRGGTAEQVEAAILGSDEYFAHAGGTNAAFLNAVYHDVLNRPVDGVGAAAFGTALAQGLPRAAVAASMLSSTEAVQDRVQSLYQQALHRSADPVGQSAFGGALERGVPDEAALAMLAASDEYFARM